MDCSPQAPPSMEFSRQEYWSGLPFPSPGDLPNPGTEPGSPTLQVEALPSEPPGNPQNFFGRSSFLAYIVLKIANILKPKLLWHELAFVNFKFQSQSPAEKDDPFV